MTLLTTHVLVAELGLVAGFVALYTAKGSTLHRRSGMLFVYAMVTMSLLGAVLAAAWGRSPNMNVPVGLLTAYLVITAQTTVRRPLRPRWSDLALTLVALAVGLFMISLAVRALGGSPGDVPPVPFLIFGSIALTAGFGDLRLIRSGGIHTVRGASRLARHLWRMCFALLIAALGLPRAVPRQFRIVPLLLLPMLLVLATLLYWLWRVKIGPAVREVFHIHAPGPEAQRT